MSSEGPILIDTRDMVALHGAFRRALGDVRGQILSVADGDTARARQIADYLDEVLWLLHAHHVGEDELLYPLLVERAPEHHELFSSMDDQHVAVASALEAVEAAVEHFGISGSAVDGQAVIDACEALLVTTEVHLSEEEEEVLPIAARLISPAEWAALPAHALSRYSGNRIWLPFGLALEAMPEASRANVLSNLPPPVSAMWFGGGSDAFANEMAVIRGS